MHSLESVRTIIRGSDDSYFNISKLNFRNYFVTFGAKFNHTKEWTFGARLTDYSRNIMHIH